ncbi:nesprin-1-like [Salarias fasciatus]|uniref:nesprin-1-like n=1 Tax=Salarias fasciatus TaxID=181472 RepID=UPI0011765F09|nr:nesprin-1-like [Salarias fasciatus]
MPPSPQSPRPTAVTPRLPPGLPPSRPPSRPYLAAVSLSSYPRLPPSPPRLAAVSPPSHPLPPPSAPISPCLTAVPPPSCPRPAPVPPPSRRPALTAPSCEQVLLKRCEAEATLVDALLKRAAEIQLGPKTQAALLEQARALSRQLEAVESGLKTEVQALETMRDRWDRFGAAFQDFSSWISDKEKQLEAVRASGSPLQDQISTVKAVGAELQDRAQALSRLEADSQALSRFVSSGEAARIRARLTQVGRFWEELKESLQQLEAQLEQSSAHQQRFQTSLDQVQTSLRELQARLEQPLTSCTSSSETYRCLQDHMDVVQGLEVLRGTLLTLAGGARRLGDRDEAEKTVSSLDSSYQQNLQDARTKQNVLEKLLGAWQRFETLRSKMASCLERSEAASRPENRCLSADRIKLRSEIQDLQALQAELQDLDPVLEQLRALGAELVSTADQETRTRLRETLETLQTRLQVQNQDLPQRLQDLQNQVSLLDQFQAALQTFSQWSQTVLSGLQEEPALTGENLQNVRAQVQEAQAALDGQAGVRQALVLQAESLTRFCSAEDGRRLSGGTEDGLQAYRDARRLAGLRADGLDRLAVFLRARGAAAGELRRLRDAVDGAGAGAWDGGRAEELRRQLDAVVPEVSRLEAEAVRLDGDLCKSHLRLGDGGGGGGATCRALADGLGAELDGVRSLLGTRQGEAEALAALWTSFAHRKQRLLEAVEDVRDKADRHGLGEPGLHALQQRLRFVGQLEDELLSLRHEQQWLRDKAELLSQRDAGRGVQALRDLDLVQTAWEDTSRAIAERQQQCSLLVELLTEFQALRTSVSSVLAGAEPLLEIGSALKDHEETKRSLTKLEALKVEMASRQHQLDRFSGGGRQLLAELKNIPGCETETLRTDTETLVDQWLDVSEKVEDRVERLNVSLCLWEDVRRLADSVETWTSSCTAELSDRLNNLDDSREAAARLDALQAELAEQEQTVDVLQQKVLDLKTSIQSAETPAKLQVLEDELRKKVGGVEKLLDQTRTRLTDFSRQRKQLEDYICQMSAWLSGIEDSLVSSPAGSDPEDICRVKELQKELQNQQGSIESTRETLTALCRKYPSQELAGLGSALTRLVKTYEAVNQLCGRTLASLQGRLQQHFNDLIQEFRRWLSEQRDIVSECWDRSGDVAVLDRKLQKLKGAAERAEDGEARLSRVSQEGQTLLLHLPKAGAAAAQQQLSSVQQDWDGFRDQCRQNQQVLEDSASLLRGFQGRLDRLRRWVEQMDRRLTEELMEVDAETSVLQQVEDFQQEALKERDSLERLCQEGQALSDGGRGDGSETRVSSQLQAQHQALLRRVSERLRSVQLALQDRQVFQDTLQSTWTWIRDVQDRLASLDSTQGSKDTLEKRLVLVQDVLLMKGEAEVKLNVAGGKGQQVLKQSRPETRDPDPVRVQLQSLQDAWGTLLMSAMSCHSRLEWTVTQWTGFLEARGQLEQWMEAVEAEPGPAGAGPPGLKEKAATLERLRAVRADVDAHAAALARLTEQAAELHRKTGDPAFGPDARDRLAARFADVSAVVKPHLKWTKGQKTQGNHCRRRHQFAEKVEVVDYGHRDPAMKRRPAADLNAITPGQCASPKLLECGVGGQRHMLGPPLRKPFCVPGDESLEEDSDQQSTSVKTRVGWRTCRAPCRSTSSTWTPSGTSATGWPPPARTCSAGPTCPGTPSPSTGTCPRCRSCCPRRPGAGTGWPGCGGARRRSGTGDRTGSGGSEALEREEAALLSSWEQWEGGARQTRSALEAELARIAASERELGGLAARLDRDLRDLGGRLDDCRRRLDRAEEPGDGEEAAAAWRAAKDVLEDLLKAEPLCDGLKTQINDLCRFSRETGSQSERVSALIKDYNSLTLQASRSCQNKEKVLDQGFRSACRDFQQWLVQARIHTAKCFEVPQTLQEASQSLARLQEFLGDREPGQSRLNRVLQDGETLSSIAAPDQVEAVRVKMSSARDDWKTLMSNLLSREDGLQNLQSQMKDLEASAEPLQENLNSTQLTVQQSSTRLHDLPAKRQELHKLQEKASRIERIVSEHQQFSQGLQDLQTWVSDTAHTLQTYCAPTADRAVLDCRMVKLEALLTARQEKEIQLKVLVTRGEAVQRNTSAEGVPAVQRQIQDLKDSWDALLSASIHCKSQLEGSQSRWTSYQDDVRHFLAWMDRLEPSLEPSDRPCPEMRDKTANLSRAKLLQEEVLSHGSLLENLSVKSAGMAENSAACWSCRSCRSATAA